MKIPVSLIVAGTIWGGYQLYNHHQSAHALRDVLANSDVNGFIEVLPPINQDPGTIYVVAAQNCPHAAAQQADRLAEQLGKQGMPVARISQVEFRPRRGDGAAMSRLDVVMKGPLPLVFIHGRAATNPEVDQVVAEYHREESSPIAP